MVTKSYPQQVDVPDRYGQPWPGACAPMQPGCHPTLQWPFKKAATSYSHLIPHSNKDRVLDPGYTSRGHCAKPPFGYPLRAQPAQPPRLDMADAATPLCIKVGVIDGASALLRPVRHYLASSETPLLRESENDGNCEAGSQGTGTMPSESIDIADKGANENEEPRDILEEDKTKQAYQLVEGRISHLSELMRCCRREGQYEVLEECANALQKIINLVPSNIGFFSRRQEMQTTGLGPDPSPYNSKPEQQYCEIKETFSLDWTLPN
ncbi:unnamed protein product [Cylicocyclus nassatus]|uniref:Uncharacterized protein n=1 Tax=Cylicocyclus nassatus TaxID=53992 RepID=A0AA36M9P9_CYLNA|nr:unnamed protein product [Cylicocyclus nassatus]